MMSKLAPKTEFEWQEDAFTEQYCRDKLTYWREHFLQAKAGVVQTPSTSDCRRSLDTWLEQFGGVLEIRWITGDESEWRRHAK